MLRSRPFVLALLVFAACPQEGTPSAPKAVVAWLDAIEAGNFEEAASLAAPNLAPTEREALAAEYRTRFGGARRVESAPFALSDPEEGKVLGKVTLTRKDQGATDVRLELEEHGGKWYVRAPEPSAQPPAPEAPPTPAEPSPTPAEPSPTDPGAWTPAP